MSISKIQETQRVSLRRLYPWIVMGIAFLTVATAFGARSAFAVFLVAVIEEFHWSRGLASGALMLGSVMWTLAAPPIGMLLDRYGPRPVLAGGALVMAAGFIFSGVAQTVMHFYFGMGVLVGIGFAALTMTSQATFLSNWFRRKRGIAIGIVASGVGLGILVVVPLTQWLIFRFGWRQTYFILAGLLILVVAPLNFFFQRQRPEDVGLTPDFGTAPATVTPSHPVASHDRGITLRQALRTGRFWAFALGVLAGAIPVHMVLIHQVAALSDAGFSKESAALALGMVGLFTSPSMILIGIVADRIGREWAYTLGSVSLMLGIALLMWARDPSQSWIYYSFPLFIAFGFSSRQSLYPTIAADLFHGKSFGAIIGAIALFIGAGAGIGPWAGGVIHDLTGSYRAAFGMALVLALVSVGFIWKAGSWRYRQPAL